MTTYHGFDGATGPTGAQGATGAPGTPAYEVVTEFPDGATAGECVVLQLDWRLYVYDGARWRVVNEPREPREFRACRDGRDEGSRGRCRY